MKEKVIKHKAEKIAGATIREEELKLKLKEASRNNSRLSTSIKCYQEKLESLSK